MLVYVSAMLLFYVMCVCVVVGNEPYNHGLSVVFVYAYFSKNVFMVPRLQCLIQVLGVQVCYETDL